MPIAGVSEHIPFANPCSWPTLWSKVLLTGHASAFDWKPCADAPKSPYADIEKVSLSPEEPAAGDTVHFAIDGTAKIDVSAGSLAIDVQYVGLPIYRWEYHSADTT